jgi:hypothetical protein
MGQPSIQVWANRLGQLPGSDPYYHLYIVVDDGKGNQTYYRGGPGNSNGGSSDASRGTTGSGRSSGESGFGKLVTEHGKFTKDSIDYQADSVRVYKANLDPKDVAGVKSNLVNQMNAIEGAKINYFPTGPNSNSTVGTAMRNLGTKNIQFPNGMWVPGFENQLINQNGRRVSSNNTGSENASSLSSAGGNNTTANSAKAAELVARANNSKQIGESSNNIEFAKNLVARATNTKSIKNQNQSNSDGLQEQKSTPTSTGAVADNKKVQQRGISRQ